MLTVLFVAAFPGLILLEKAVEESLAASAMSALNQPKAQPTQPAQPRDADNLADASKLILHCYHNTAQFRQVDLVEVPWKGQSKYGAEKSMLVRISYVGLTNKRYEMLTAIMTKDRAARAQVLDDNNP